MNRQLKQRIKSKQRAYSQKYIARKVGISATYLSLIINGRRKCPDRLLKKIKKYLEA